MIGGYRIGGWSLRILIIRAVVFAAIFFAAGLLLHEGSFWRVLLLTLVATAVYLGFTVAVGWVRRK